MIAIKLDEFATEDFKCIQTLKNMGVSEELIQFGYNNTQNKREQENKNEKTMEI